jgi:hypothetical protein
MLMPSGKNAEHFPPILRTSGVLITNIRCLHYIYVYIASGISSVFFGGGRYFCVPAKYFWAYLLLFLNEKV